MHADHRGLCGFLTDKVFVLHVQFFATLLSRDELANCGQDVKGVLSCDLGLPSMLLQALACLPKLVEPPAGALDAAGASAQSVQASISIYVFSMVNLQVQSLYCMSTRDTL